MNETPRLFSITPSEFWKQISTTIEEMVAEKLKQQIVFPGNDDHLPEKALL